MYQNIGAMIRHYRKKQQLTLVGLAQRAGVGKTAVFDVEHGKPSVQLQTLVKILNALDIHLVFRTPTADVAFKTEEPVEAEIA